MNAHSNAPEPADLAARLSGAPGSKERFGKDAAGVLETARLIAAANAAWDKQTVRTFLEQQKLNPQVWDKLLGIAKSKNLDQVPEEHLPASYTALYALVVMKEEELAAALKEDVVRARASSRSILEWTKAYRLRGTGVEQEIPLTLVLRDDLTKEQQQDLLNALQVVAGQFGADLLEGKGGLKQATIKAEARKARAQEIEEELLRLIGPDVMNAPEDLKSKFGVSSALDLIEGRREPFTGFFQLLLGKVPGAFWRTYGRAYCLKIARDYNLTSSRTERYQLKDRLQKATEKWSTEIVGFVEMVQDVLSTYMNA